MAILKNMGKGIVQNEELLNEEELISEIEQEESSYDTYVEDGISAYLKEIRGYRILSKQEVSDLIYKMKEGDVEAKNTIISHNLKLAFHVAKKYAGRGVPLLDLVQEANLGLVKAVEKFDPDTGYAFSTYALWWTTATVRRYIQEYGGNIKIPTYVNERITKVDRVIREFEADGDTVTPEEIAEALNVSVEDVKHAMRSKKISSVLSLDFSLDDTDPLANLIADNKQDVEHIYLQDESKRLLIETIKKACKNERESDIILRSFGFYGEQSTLEEIGEIYGITKERVRQIKEKALQRLQGIISGEIKDKPRKRGKEPEVRIEDIRKALMSFKH